MNLLQRMKAGIRSLVEDANDDRVRPLDNTGAFEDAVRKLTALEDPRISAIVRDIGARLASPPSGDALADALTRIAERVSSDARIPAQTKDAAKAIAYRGRDALRAGVPAVSVRRA